MWDTYQKYSGILLVRPDSHHQLTCFVSSQTQVKELDKIVQFKFCAVINIIQLLYSKQTHIRVGVFQTARIKTVAVKNKNRAETWCVFNNELKGLF